MWGHTVSFKYGIIPVDSDRSRRGCGWGQAHTSRFESEAENITARVEPPGPGMH